MSLNQWLGLWEAHMRIACLVVALPVLSGCATMTYTSDRSALEVSQCIADGWRRVPSSGWELPVSLTKSEDHFFVDVVLVQDFPTFIPTHSMRAKVWDSSAGSTTTYHRNLQISHKKIDRVVVECQGKED